MSLLITYPTVQRSLQKIVPAGKSDSNSSQEEDNSRALSFFEHLLISPTVKKKAEANRARAFDLDGVSVGELFQTNPCKLLHLNQFFRV